MNGFAYHVHQFRSMLGLELKHESVQYQVFHTTIFSPSFVNSLFYPLHATVVLVSASRHNHTNIVHMFCNSVIRLSHTRIKREIDFYGLFIRVNRH